MLKTDELRTKALASLVTPETLANELPISQEIISNITSARQRIEAILTGEDKRLLVIIGPCSIHAVSYTHLTLPTNTVTCRSRWSPYH